MPYKDKTIARAKKRGYAQTYYQRNSTASIARSASRRALLRTAWAAYKKSKSCKKCGASHPAIIDFHHIIRVNKKSVRGLIDNNNLHGAIREAEEKCIPLCANCHRILHWNENKKKARRKKV